jgi:hypothetical protein
MMSVLSPTSRRGRILGGGAGRVPETPGKRGQGRRSRNPNPNPNPNPAPVLVHLLFKNT